MFDRTIKLIVEENFNKITNTTVLVVGIGGVGGYAVEGLVRSGISSFILVDYDTVDITNINRQITADTKHLGYFKVDVMERRILNINPNCKVIKLYDKLNLDNIDNLFKYSFDYLIDACDTIVVKEELIKLCVLNNIEIKETGSKGKSVNNCINRDTCLKKRIFAINPNCKVIKLYDKLSKDNLGDLFKYSFDYLIDACDTIVVKEELIKLCILNNIEIISCMGTGNKINPSELEITDIWKTSYDPIAKKIRKYLKDEKIYKKIPVVYSKEQNDKFEGSIPSMIFVPASAGLLSANYVIKSIINRN